MPILSSVPFRAFLLMGTLTCGLLLAAPEKQPLAELQKSLAVGLEKNINAPKYASAHWGVRVEKLDGTLLYDWQGKKAFMPASQMKVFTTAAALDLLGPEYRYTTRVELHGEQRDTTFHGDVVLVGSGDPTLGAWHGEGVKESAVLLKEWTEALKARGINRIEGRIIGDGRVFTKEFIHTGWHYGDLPYWYAAGSSGLAMEENAFRCEIKAGANVGDKATVSWTPPTKYINVLVDTVTVEEKAPSTADSFNYQTEGNTIWFGGQIPKGTVVKERASIWDGVRYSAFLFTEMCEKEGITVTGEAANILDVSPLQDATPELLLVHQSVPMQKICTVINQVSHNFYADQVLRTLGERYGEVGSFSAGVKVVRDWMRSRQLPYPNVFQMVDGSGLSTDNRFTPEQATSLYRLIHREPRLRESFVGTLKPQEYSFGVVKAKSGYIGGVRTLGGYLELKSGETIVFSFLCNQFSTSAREVSTTNDAMLETIARELQ